MIARVAIHESLDTISDERFESFRAWMKSQPGFVSGWHLRDTATGRTLSFSVWETRETATAMKDRTPPGGPIGIKPMSAELFDEVHEFVRR